MAANSGTTYYKVNVNIIEAKLLSTLCVYMLSGKILVAKGTIYQSGKTSISVSDCRCTKASCFLKSWQIGARLTKTEIAKITSCSMY